MIVYTGGTFDLLHVGHLELLRGCRLLAGQGGTVVAAVNRDEFITRYKGHPPKMPLGHRLELLRGLRLVDMVVVNVGDEDSRVTLDVVRPDVIAVGDDWLDPGHDQSRYWAQLGVTAEWLDERGLRVEYLRRGRGMSSTELRRRE